MAYRSPPPRTRWVPIVIGLLFAVVAVVILLILFFPTAFGFSAPSGPYRYGLGGVFVLFFVVIVLFFIVRVAFWSMRASRYSPRSRGGGPAAYAGPNRPAMIARMRYARGEITREQYEQILQDLRRPPGTP
jgi:uncharacterized membrane protein